MKKNKLLYLIIVLAFLLLIPCVVKAAEPETSSTQINGVTIDWEYELNKDNQIINLKCKNVQELKGDVVIPTVINGKTVIGFGAKAFANATEITSVTIPKTLRTTSGYDPIFGGCTKLTKITLEEGMTIVPEYLCAETNIDTIEIPQSVKEIDMKAFADCKNLKNINLGKIEQICAKAFKNCIALENIKIPKTLRTTSGLNPIFGGCTKLTKITLEEGMTVVPDYLCAETPIESIVIPKSVKEIGYKTFADCKKLKNINLGNVEDLGNNSFQNCILLESVTIPKTLKSAAITPIFNGCTNLTKIILEEGITIVPQYLCAETNIEEIEIPKSVTDISHSAFENCKKLKKVTILGNLKYMGFLTLPLPPEEDSVFQNHNEDLTIYCYEDSMSVEYAKKYNIKYEYLPRKNANTEDKNVNTEDKNVNTEDKNVNTEDKNNIDKKEENNNNLQNPTKDGTLAPGVIPQTGEALTIIISIIVTLLIGIICLAKYRKNKDIK